MPAEADEALGALILLATDNRAMDDGSISA
jgi:hypothetical protein